MEESSIDTVDDPRPDSASSDFDETTDDPSAEHTPRETTSPGAGGHVPCPEGYELLDELGRGGMGVVYKARQTRLKRLVALKMIRGRAVDESERIRFRTEAEAVARLQHPNIVQIHDVDEFEGQLYCALEFVAGGSLDTKLRGTPLSPAGSAQLVETMARAMHVAHEQNLVHRDLKPANILLTDEGERPENWTPKIADFGLAKLLDEEATGLTQADVIMGTPSYMAPEQAEGKTAEVDPKADVYALGAILYECLTGRPPFRASNKLETLEQVRSVDPVPIRSLQPGVPRDLETIALQCLRKEPQRRYRSAEHLAEDLRRFREGEPISARPIGLVERAGKWVKRRPFVAGMIALLVCTVAVFSGVLYQRNLALESSNSQLSETANQLQRKTTEALAQKKKAEDAGKLAKVKEAAATRESRRAIHEAEMARRGEFAAQLAQASLLAERDPVAAQALLTDPSRCPPDLRDFTWRLLYSASKRDLYSIYAPGDIAFVDDVLLVWSHSKASFTLSSFHAEDGTRHHEIQLPGIPTFSKDRRRLAWLDPEGELRQWHLISGRELPTHRLEGADSPALHTFSEDLRSLVTIDKKSTFRVWDTSTGQTLCEGRLDGPAKKIVFTPNRDKCVIVQANAGDTHKVSLWDAKSGKELRKLDGTFARTSLFLISPDGKKLFSWGRTSRQKGYTPIEVNDLETGKKSLLPSSDTHAMESLQFAAGGRTLIAFSRTSLGVAGGGNHANALAMWDISSTPPRRLTSQRLIDAKLVLSADGNTLMLGAYEGFMVFDTRTGVRTKQLSDLLRRLSPLAVSPDGKSFVTGGIKLWDVGAGRERMLLPSAGKPIFSPDGNRLALRSSQGALTVWNISPDVGLSRSLDWNQPVVSVSLTPDGETLALYGGRIDGFPAGRHGELRLFDTQSGKLRSTLYDPEGYTHISTVKFSPTGDRLAWDDRGSMRFLPADGSASTSFSLDRNVPKMPPGLGFPFLGSSNYPQTLLAFDPVKPRLAFSKRDKILFRDSTSGKELDSLDVPERVVTSPQFDREGKYLAVGSETGHVWLRERRSGKFRKSPYRHEGKAATVAIHPQGTTIASSGSDGVIVLWNLEKNEHSYFRGHKKEVSALAFSPNEGRTLVSASLDQTVRFWDPVSGRTRATFSKHTFPVSCLAFDKAGQTLVTGSSGQNGGEALVWRVRTPPVHQAMFPHDEPLVRVAVSPKGTELATLSRSGKMRRWDLLEGRELDPTPVSLRQVGTRSLRGSLLATLLDFTPDNVVRVRGVGKRNSGSAIYSWRADRDEPEWLSDDSLRGKWMLDAVPGTDLGIRVGKSDTYLPPKTLRIAIDWETGKSKVLSDQRMGTPIGMTGDQRFLVTTTRTPFSYSCYDGKTNKLLWSKTPVLEQTKAGPLPVRETPRLFVLSDNKHLWAQTSRALKLVDLATGKILLNFEGWLQFVVSPNAGILAILDKSKTLHLYRTSPFEKVGSLEEKLAVLRMGFTYDNKILFYTVGGRQGNLVGWSVEEKKEVCRLELNGQGGPLLPFPGGKRILVGGQLWDWRKGTSQEAKLPTLGTSSFTDDGKTMVTLQGSRCQLWDLEKLAVRATLQAKPRDRFLKLAATPDDKNLILLSPSSLYVFDMASGKEKAVHPLGVPSFGGPSTFLVGVDDESVILLRQGPRELAPTMIRSLRGNRSDDQGSQIDSGTVSLCQLSRDGQRVVVYLRDQQRNSALSVWDRSTGHRQCRIPFEGTSGTSLAASDRHFALGENSGRIELRSFDDLEKKVELIGSRGAIRALAFSQDGAWLASAGEDLVIRLWNVETGRLHSTLEGHQQTITDLTFGPAASSLYSVSDDGSARSWNLDLSEKAESEPAPTILDTTFPVAVTDREVVFQGFPDGHLDRIDLKTKKRTALPTRHDGAVLVVRLSPDGSLLATGTAKGEVKLIDTKTGLERYSWKDHRFPIRALAFDPQGRRLASGGGRTHNLFGRWHMGEIYIRGWEDGLVHRLPSRRGCVNALVFSHSGRTLLSGGDDNAVTLWNVDTSVPFRTLQHPGPVTAMVHPKPNELITACRGGYASSGRSLLQIWDPDRGTKLSQLGTTANDVRDLTVGAGLLGAVHFDGTLAFRDIENRRELMALGVVDDPIQNVALSSNGNIAVASLESGTLRVYDADTFEGEPLLEEEIAGSLVDPTWLGDGDRLASVRVSSSWTRLTLFDRKTRKTRTLPLWSTDKVPTQRYPSLGSRVASLVVSRDGRFGLIAYRESGIVPRRTQQVHRLVDLDSFELLPTKFEKGVRIATFHPKSNHLAYVDGVGALHFLDPTTGNELPSIRVEGPPTTTILFSPTGTLLACARTDGSIVLLQTEGNKIRATLTGHKKPLLGLTFRADASVLASQDGDRIVKLWDCNSGKELGSLDLKKRVQASVRTGETDMAFIDGKPTLVTLSLPAGLVVWKLIGSGEDEAFAFEIERAIPGVSRERLVPEPKTGTIRVIGRGIRRYDLETGRLLVARLSGRGVSASDKGPLAVIDGKGEPEITSVTLARSVEIQGRPRRLTALIGPVTNPSVVALMPGEETMATVGPSLQNPKVSGPVMMWTIPQGRPTTRPTPLWQAEKLGDVRYLQATSKGDLVAATPAKVLVLAGKDGKVLETITPPSTPITGLAASPSSDVVAVRTDKTWTAWRLGKEEPLGSGQSDKALSSIAVSPDGQRVVTGTSDGLLELWQAGGKSEKRWRWLDAEVRLLAFSPDGTLLATGASTGLVQVWDLATGKAKMRTWRYRVELRGLTISSDNKTVAVSNKNAVQLTDIEKTKGQTPIQAPNGLSVGFREDGSLYYLSARTTGVRFWSQIRILDDENTWGNPRSIVPLPKPNQ